MPSLELEHPIAKFVVTHVAGSAGDIVYGRVAQAAKVVSRLLDRRRSIVGNDTTKQRVPNGIGAHCNYVHLG